MSTDEKEIRKPDQAAIPAVDQPVAATAAPVVAKKSTLPFSFWWPIAGGVIVGTLLRLIFSGAAGGAWSAMSWPFISFAPFAVSAVTVYIAKHDAIRKGDKTWMDCFALGASANLFFVIGTMLIMIEGLICAVVIVPLFMLYGGIGGLIMGAICKWTDWPKSSTYGFVALPVVLALVTPAPENKPLIDSIERTVIIQSRAENIWPHLMNADDIKPNEVDRGWLYRIGVPLPEAGVTQQSGNELVRNVTMGKAIHFEQRSSEWRKNEFVRWTYRFAADSFPPRALDDHVQIGGHYFDIIDTKYTLTPHGTDATQLKIEMTYRVSTDFDWYANGVAQLLIGNFGDVILDFYRARAERSPVVAVAK
jgi:hypothetical protein